MGLRGLRPVAVSSSTTSAHVGNRLPPGPISFWGAEYWVYRDQSSDPAICSSRPRSWLTCSVPVSSSPWLYIQSEALQDITFHLPRGQTLSDSREPTGPGSSQDHCFRFDVGEERRAGGGATCTAPPPYRPPAASSPALPPLAKLAAGPSSAPSSRACSVSSRPFGSGPCLLDGGPDGQRTSTKSLIPVLSCPSSDKSMKDGMHTKSRPAGAT